MRYGISIVLFFSRNFIALCSKQSQREFWMMWIWRKWRKLFWIRKEKKNEITLNFSSPGPSCSLHWRVVPVSGNSAIRFQQLLLIGFKVHSHGTTADATFWPQQMGCIGFNVSVHTTATAATMPQVNGFGTHFVWQWQQHHEISPYSGTLKSLNFSNFWTF